MVNGTGLQQAMASEDTTKVARIEQLLRCGCESLNASQGVALCLADDYTDVIARATLQKPPSLPLMPPLPFAKSSPLPTSHEQAEPRFLHWANLYLGASSFVCGDVYAYGSYQVVFIFIFDTPITYSRELKDKLTLLNGWLKSLLIEVEYKDSFKNNLLFEKLQSVANIGTWEVDLLNNSLTWSSQTRVIHEVDENFIPQLDTAIYFYKEGHDRDEISRIVSTAIKTGESWNATLQLISAKGNPVWIETHGMAEMVDGVCVRLFGTCQNVNKAMALRLELDEQREAAVKAYNARGELLSRISHELRTPLNGITGMLQAIRFEDREHIRARKTELALKSSDKLLSLINDVLDYTDMSSGNFELVTSDFCVRALVEDLLDVFMPQCQEKGLRLYSGVAFPPNTYIHSDAARISQVLNNLMSNAVKYTAQGHISVHVTLKDVADVQHLLISVEDSGKGMSEATVKSLFVPLIHGDKFSSVEGSGSGLGLSIAKQIIDKMEGELDITTEEGKGSCFDIVIPIEKPSAKKTEMSDTDSLPSTLLALPLSILVVDDNDINRIVLSSMLEKFNFKADEAQNGRIAVEKAKAKPYDIIFMDCSMPVLDGLSATKIIVGEGYLPVNGRVIAVTANTTDDDRQACHKAGMADFLAKPVEQTSVTNILRQVLHNKASAIRQH